MNYMHLKYFFLFPLIYFISFHSVCTNSQSLSEIESHRVLLPNGWKITKLGESIPVGDLPLNIAVSPSGKYIAVTNNGVGDQTIDLIDVNKQVKLDTVLIAKSWLGLSFSDDENFLYASGGNDNWIVKFAIINNHLVSKDTFVLGKPWPVQISVAGLTVDDKRHRLYVVTKDNKCLYIIDTETKKIIKQLSLGAEAYTCILSPDKKVLYVSCWGCRKILMFDTDRQIFIKSVDVGSNPNDICISKNGRYLFVANANDNSVSVIDLKPEKLIETLNAALYPNSLAGSTTNSVALSSDNKTLYIANADNNCLAVFDVSQPGESKGKGFIPVGWYPTCVRVVNNKIYVTNGKGFTSMATPRGPSPLYDETVYQQAIKNKQPIQYIGSILKGQLSIINSPDEKQLAIYSQAVYNNTPYTKEKETIAEGKAGDPVPLKLGGTSPIKYIYYIIKENRTYDQVLGDLPQGNGDTSLVLFGENITPNQHALAKEFVLLDNFYCDGEVSADGHNWSTGAYATDYLEKTWPTSYGGRGGKYDSEGQREIANNKNGFIWDFCKRAGVSYRTYGEFIYNGKPTIPALKDHYCHYFSEWNQEIRDTTRFYQWKREFDSLVVAGNLPHMNTVRFINDHTSGLTKGKATPFASVADNDLAVGLFIDHLSHSPVWNETAVFIVEDDAQDGPDHVDAHRSIAFVAGGFVKKGFTDHTMYSTSSILHTIELILDIPPMSQYDASATPMWRCFTDSSKHEPFNVKPCLVDLNQKNTAQNKWSVKSAGFDFSKEDLAPEKDLNEVIWVAVKGENSSCPPPKHSAFFHPTDK